MNDPLVLEPVSFYMPSISSFGMADRLFLTVLIEAVTAGKADKVQRSGQQTVLKQLKALLISRWTCAGFVVDDLMWQRRHGQMQRFQTTAVVQAFSPHECSMRSAAQGLRSV